MKEFGIQAGGRMGLFKEIEAESAMLRDGLLAIIKQRIDSSRINVYDNRSNGCTIKIRSENCFKIDVVKNEIVLIFHKEHQHFYLFDYKTIEEFISAVKDFVFDVYFNPIKFEYIYKASKLMAQRVYKMDASTKEWEKISSTVTNLNPILIFSKKYIESEIIRFSQ